MLLFVSWWLWKNANRVITNGIIKNSTIEVREWIWRVEISAYKEFRGILRRSIRCWGKKKNVIIIGLIENRRYE